MRPPACRTLAVALTVLCVGVRPARAGGFDVAAEAGSDLAAKGYRTQLRLRGEATDWLWGGGGLTALFETGQLRGDSLYQGGLAFTVRGHLSDDATLRAAFGPTIYSHDLPEGASGLPLAMLLESAADYAVSRSLSVTLTLSIDFRNPLLLFPVGHYFAPPLFSDLLAGVRMRF